MENKKIFKFENPARMKELNPYETLKKIGFSDGMTLCDIGAGTGVFSFSAAKISNEKIFALDVMEDMLELLKKRVLEKKLNNVEVLKVDSKELPVDSGTCDMVLMVTVMHEIDDKPFMIKEIKRILKEKGKLFVIEFHKKRTPIGPPENHRISENQLESICSEGNFEVVEKFSMGENFYGIVFKKGILN